MSESTDTTNWDDIVSGGDGTASAASAKGSASAAGAQAAAYNNLPPFPEGFSYMVGRLPIKGSPGRAIVQLPEPIKGVSCAFTVANTTVLKSCENPKSGKCGRPSVVHSEPLNDRDILVTLDEDNGETVKGHGWVPSSSYPGATLTTRKVETGTPVVEVMLIIGPECGCDETEWAADDPWGQ